MRNIGYITLTAWCLLFAGAFNGLMDALAFHNAGRHFENREFWGSPDETWTNKWAISPTGEVLVGKERFFLSSTFLSFATDGWHLAKGGMLLGFLMAVVFAARLELPDDRRLFYSALLLVGSYLCFSVGFLVYRLM